MLPLEQVVLLALAVSSATMTISKSKVFKPLRDALIDTVPFLGALISCPYCTSHWLAFALCAYYQPRAVHGGVAVADVIVTAFMVVTLAAAGCWVIYHAIAAIPANAARKE